MNWLTKAANSITAMLHGGKPPFMMGLLKRTRFDYRREVGDCMDSSVVTAPVMWVARALPEAKFIVHKHGRDGAIDDQPDHPMLALLQNPNPFYGDIALWMATLVSFLISGNAYWMIVRNGVGRPAELWYVPHWMMEPKWKQDGSEFISYYRYAPGGGVAPIEVPSADVVHFRHGLDPRNIRMGLSPLDGVIREIFIDLESSNFVASLLRNMGVPGVVISPKGGAMPAPEDVEATKTWFRQAFGGDNRGGPLVMGAPTDVQAYGFNPQQLNMSEGRDVAEERVCACLGIPAAVVGFGAGMQQTKVGATMEELRKLAWNNGVLPFARMLADELQRSLLGEFGQAQGLSVCIDTDRVIALQEDEDKKSDRALKQFQAGAISFFEVRRRIGEDDNADGGNSTDFFLRSFSMIEVPVGQSRALPAPAPVPALPAPKGAKQDEHDHGDHVVIGRASEAVTAQAMAFARLMSRLTEGAQAGFEQRLVNMFQSFGARTLEVVTPLLEADQPVAPGKGAKARQAKSDDLLVAMILERLGIPLWQGELQAGYEAQYLEVAHAVQDAAEQAALGTSMPDVVARSILAAGGRRTGLVDLAEQTRVAVFNALAAGRAAGEGPIQMAARIAGQVEGGPWSDAGTRARTIARTETTYARNISIIELARSSGATSMIVTDGLYGPRRSTPSHIARNGSIVSIAAAEQMAEDEHPNGTLCFVPNFEEF